jgi:hypothetical protein
VRAAAVSTRLHRGPSHARQSGLPAEGSSGSFSTLRAPMVRRPAADTRQREGVTGRERHTRPHTT